MLIAIMLHLKRDDGVKAIFINFLYIFMSFIVLYLKIIFIKIMDYIVLINVLVSLSILNVWLLRFNNQTPYRGGDSNTLKEDVYGLPTWFMYLIGIKSNFLAILLIVGIWKKHINIYVVSSMIILMLGALVMHYG